MKKIAFITGSSRGIGKATARRLCEDGYAIILHAKTTSDALTKTAREIQKNGTLIESVCFDIADPSQIEAVCIDLQKRIRHIDVLVNNAGMSDDALFLKMKSSQWESVIHANLNGPFHVTKQFLPKMVQNNFGRIINVSSIAAYGAHGKTNYAAAKAGLIGMTKSLALEVAKNNITVNAVCPGFITTDLSSQIPPLYQKKILSQIASKRAGTPEEVANLISFLASKQSSYITGAVIDINGGWQ